MTNAEHFPIFHGSRSMKKLFENLAKNIAVLPLFGKPFSAAFYVTSLALEVKHVCLCGFKIRAGMLHKQGSGHYFVCKKCGCISVFGDYRNFLQEYTIPKDGKRVFINNLIVEELKDVSRKYRRKHK
mgnify:CR=1 FL=1